MICPICKNEIEGERCEYCGYIPGSSDYSDDAMPGYNEATRVHGEVQSDNKLRTELLIVAIMLAFMCAPASLILSLIQMKKPEDSWTIGFKITFWYSLVAMIFILMVIFMMFFSFTMIRHYV